MDIGALGVPGIGSSDGFGIRSAGLGKTLILMRMGGKFVGRLIVDGERRIRTEPPADAEPPGVCLLAFRTERNGRLFETVIAADFTKRTLTKVGDFENGRTDLLHKRGLIYSFSKTSGHKFLQTKWSWDSREAEFSKSASQMVAVIPGRFSSELAP